MSPNSLRSFESEVPVCHMTLKYAFSKEKLFYVLIVQKGLGGYLANRPDSSHLQYKELVWNVNCRFCS